MKRILTLATALTLNACDNTPAKSPAREDYARMQGAISTSQGMMHVEDENGDGKVDVFFPIQHGYVYYLADGHKTRYQTTARTQTITADERELASQILKLQRELRYKMDTTEYERREK